VDRTVTVQSYNQKIAERSCSLQIPHVPNVQQIKTSVRGYNLLPGRPQLVAATGKLIKLDDFWAHSFSLILRLRVNRTWPLTDLRNGLPRMAKRKTKHNAGRSMAPRGFEIRQGPMVDLAEDASLPDVHNRIGPTRVCEEPFLFAIARDAGTIFASWNINWRSVFEKAMPADRQVHLRVIGGDGVIETRVAVEPMSAMHYVTISGLHNSYRVEIGYFQPFDTWHTVATSCDVEMPPQGSVELGEVDLATIPFHLSFQQLANLFGATNNTSVASLVSEFQKRVLSSDKANAATPSDTQILGSLNLSLPEIVSAERDFRKIDAEKLARRSYATLRFAATSPARGFEASVAGS
jgi:hypothetical protein